MQPKGRNSGHYRAREGYDAVFVKIMVFLNFIRRFMVGKPQAISLG